MTTYTCLKDGFENMDKMNCAEKVLNAANVAYDLGLSPESLKLAAGFGGGMGVKTVCGAASAGCMVLSDLFVDQYAHENNKRINQLTAKLIGSMQRELGCFLCRDLQARYRTPERGCQDLIEEVAKLLDNIIAEEKAEVQNGK